MKHRTYYLEHHLQMIRTIIVQPYRWKFFGISAEFKSYMSYPEGAD